MPKWGPFGRPGAATVVARMRTVRPWATARPDAGRAIGDEPAESVLAAVQNSGRLRSTQARKVTSSGPDK